VVVARGRAAERVAVPDRGDADAMGPGGDLLAPGEGCGGAVPEIVEALLVGCPDGIEAEVARPASRTGIAAHGLPVGHQPRRTVRRGVADGLRVIRQLGPRAVAADLREVSEERRGVVRNVGFIAAAPRSAPRTPRIDRPLAAALEDHLAEVRNERLGLGVITCVGPLPMGHDQAGRDVDVPVRRRTRVRNPATVGLPSRQYTTRAAGLRFVELVELVEDVLVSHVGNRNHRKPLGLDLGHRGRVG